MRGVNGPTYVKIDIRRFLKQQLADQGSAVLLIAPFVVSPVFGNIVLGIFHDAVDGNHAFRHQIHTLQRGNRRNVAVKLQGRTQRLVQPLCRDGGCRSAADNVLSFLGKEKAHHAVCVVPVAGRAEKHVHRHPLPHPDHTGGGVVPRFPAVKPVAFIHQHRGKHFGGISAKIHRFHKGNDVFPFPAEIVADPDPGVRASVAHGNKDVVFLQTDHRTEDLLPSDGSFLFRIVEVLTVPEQNHMRIVILNDFGGTILHDPQNGEGGIGNAPNRADGKRRRDGFHAFLQGQAGSQHGGNNLAGQRGQNAGFHTAAKSVGQHDDGGAVLLFHNVHMVSAQLFSGMIDTLKADFAAQVIHWQSTPSAWTGRSWSPRRFRRAAKRSPARFSSVYRQPCPPPPPSDG